MADAAELIKHTGRFYDRYSETHKANTAGGKQSPSVAGNSRGGNAEHNATSTSSAAAAESHPWVGEESSRSILRRTVELGVGTATVATASASVRRRDGCDCAVGAALKEMDHKCYSLLESNAQLCLRVQGLGLEYAGLTRELLDSGWGEVSGPSTFFYRPHRTHPCRCRFCRGYTCHPFQRF